jgi:hypothetical protein
MSSWGNRRKISGIDNNRQNDANIDQFGNLRVRNLIWDTGLLAWVADTGGGGLGGGGHVTVDNWPGNYPTGGLTDVELRATPVPVSGTFWPADQPVSGPLTDAQLRDTPVPVSGPLTDTQLRATPLPVSGTVTATVSFPATQQTLEQALAILIDEASATVLYIGEAAPGSPQGDALWRIKKIDTTSGMVLTWADGNTNFDNVWTGRAGLSYS